MKWLFPSNIDRIHSEEFTVKKRKILILKVNNLLKKHLKSYRSKVSLVVKYTSGNFLVCMTLQVAKGTQINLCILYEQQKHNYTLEL